MKYHILTVFILLLSLPAFSQGIAGRWLVYEGSDGAELVVTISSAGTGKAELSLVRIMEAISYCAGSQYWGTFRVTGGYYFQVKGSKKVSVSVSRSDSTLVVRQTGKPTLSVTARLGEEYSTREISDYGDYKRQVVAQWKRDFPYNEDVKKGKWIMESYFTDYYDGIFDYLLEGKFRIVESDGSTLVLKKAGSDNSPLLWKKEQ